MLEHGGRLRAAALQYGIAEDQWLDLSAALNPDIYPVGEIPASVWQRLPEDDDALVQAASFYYGAKNLLPVAGSQSAIQALPLLLRDALPGQRIGLLQPTYSEHAHAWRKAGFVIVELQPDKIDDEIASLDALLIVNPNNPTGAVFSVDSLLGWHRVLAKKNACLIVDEAFIDATPQHTVAQYANQTGLIVLRSLGKFFGLAGARVGFVMAESSLLNNLHEQLGPWAISHPSRWVAIRALRDSVWQANQRQVVAEKSARLAQLLTQYGLAPTGGCELFQWVSTARAAQLHHALAQQGILVRLFAEPASLRLGLPASERDWLRLTAALDAVTA
jgi:cobalamin biosynthetic protein CobC